MPAAYGNSSAVTPWNGNEAPGERNHRDKAEHRAGRTGQSATEDNGGIEDHEQKPGLQREMPRSMLRANSDPPLHHAKQSAIHTTAKT